MNVIEFIRETTENLQQNNAEFIAKIEPRFRVWSDILTDKIDNTLNNPWISRLNPFEDIETEEETVLQGLVAERVFKSLKKQLGTETFLGNWYLVDQNCIDQFADVTGDHQWIHTDPDRAREESPFKSTIAHGFLTLALIPTLTESDNPDNNPFPEARIVVNSGLNQVRFPFPVKSGSRVRARTRLIEVIPMRRSIEVVNEVSIEVEKSRRPACVAETVMRLYF
jgi:acyl dehydratase